MRPTENLDLQQRVYDHEVERGATAAAVETARIKLIRRFAMALPPGKLVDLGCSDGSVIAPLNARHSLHGVDISKKCVAEARKSGIDAIQGDVESDLPYEDGSFDIVVSAEIIEHIVRTDAFLHEINRITRKDGHVIITTPNVAV